MTTDLDAELATLTPEQRARRERIHDLRNEAYALELKLRGVRTELQMLERREEKGP